MRSNNPNILIVDDEIDICLLLSDILSDKYTVDYAQSISDARRKLSAYSPGLLLLDLDLPDGSGFDLIRQLGNDPSSKPRILIISAHKSQAEKKQADALGVTHFIEKPLDINTIKKAVSTLIS